ncbi:unnamed protein product [Rangifer tarandus platyrhynchus]|uniref:Uncharacterized protein n=2 Tax=Rangifer tarandus platyrhynchus TaxID=3082113 RepID=A0AC59ZQ24_RANTA|nr:unnamed protein product [Rangifer tarandus platyrhynchus]
MDVYTNPARVSLPAFHPRLRLLTPLNLRRERTRHTEKRLPALFDARGAVSPIGSVPRLGLDAGTTSERVTQKEKNSWGAEGGVWTHSFQVVCLPSSCQN